MTTTEEEVPDANAAYLPDTQALQITGDMLDLIYDYIASYGVALGIMNMAVMHGLQPSTGDIEGFEASTCFKNAFQTSIATEAILNINNYANGVPNQADFLNLASQLQLKFTDQSLSCGVLQLMNEAKAMFEFQPVERIVCTATSDGFNNCAN